jgi:hypothetical protein
MAFPTSPVDGQRYQDYTYSLTTGAWEKTPKGTILTFFKQTDTGIRNITAVYSTFADSLTWNEMICAGLSRLEILLKVNGRNDEASSWGGIFTKLLYRIDTGSGYGSYTDLGHSGYDLSMVTGGSSIESRVHPLTMDMSAYDRPFKIQFKTQHAVYTSGTTARINDTTSDTNFKSSLRITEIAV